MPTTIDSLQIEIQSSSTNASAGIRDLARSLGELKKNGTVNVAVKNLEKLSGALRGFADASNVTRSVGKLVGTLERLKSVGSITSIGSGLTKLGESLKTVGSTNVDAVAPKIEQIAAALAPLSQVKSGGISTMVNGLSKLGKVTESLDDKTIAAFAERIEKLNAVLGPLSEKMTTVQAGLRGINSKARSAGSSIKQMGDDVNVASLNFSTITHAIQTVVQALQQAIQKFKEIISQAIEWDGIAARFGRGFGGQAQETYEWIQRLNEEMGINVQQFMQYSSIYSTMLTGFGVATEDATKMALGYTELTYDIWAGYNDVYKKFADAAEAVKSAIAGEVEPIRRAGFTIVESTLEQTAANYGLNISLEKATEAQKSYLRYLTLVDQAHAQNLVGTYAKELSTAEGLMRTFAQQTKSLAQAFGSLFLPILVKVMPYVQAFVELLTEGVRALANLFGFEIQEVSWSGYGEGSDTLDGVKDSANGATEAIKDLKNATTGIDELNVISPPSASSGGSGSGVGTGFESLDVNSLWDETIFENVKTTVSDIVKKMKEWLGLTEPIETWAEFFETRLGRILTLVGLIGGGLAVWSLTKKFLSGIDALTAILASPVRSISLGLVLTVTGFAIEFSGIKDAIKRGLDGVNFGEIFLGGLTGAGGTAILGAGIASWITKVFSGSAIATAINTAATNLGLGSAGAAGAALGGGIGGVIAGIPAMFVGIYDAIKNGMDWLNGILIPAGGAAAGAGIATILTAAGTAVAPGVGTLVGLIVGLLVDGIILAVQNWDKIKKFFRETIPEWFDTVDWNAVGKKVGNFLTEAFIFVTNPFAGIARLLEKVFDFEIDWGKVGESVGYGLAKAVDFALEWLNPVSLTKKFVKWLIEVDWGKVWSEVVSFVKEDIPKWWSEIGSECVSGIWQGISDSWTDFQNDVRAFIDGFVRGVKKALGIASPSKVFAQIGKYCIEGLLGALSPTAIRERVSTMWNQAKIWWEKTKSKLSTYTPSIGNIKDKLSSAWTSARTWWNAKKSALASYTPTIGSIKDKLVSAWNTAKKWWSNNVKLSIPSLSFKVTYTKTGLNALQKGIVKVLGLEGWPKLSFAANGGIFDQGSLIWAGERGPEIAATAAGGKTGVMNVQQMQDAMYDGVYAAVVAAMRATSGGDGGQPVNVYLDGRQVTAAVEQRQRERGVSIMGSQVYSY